MYPHRIRLRGPWECVPLAWFDPAEAEPLPTARRTTMPCRWGERGLPGFHGTVRFVRKFGYPGRIDDFERVWLTFGGVAGTAKVWLNDVALGGVSDADVTRSLRDRNELRVEISGDERSGLWGEVALEVRCSAYLRAVRVEPRRRDDNIVLDVFAEVVGEAAGPLELYVLCNRSTVAYSLVAASETGAAYHLISEPLDAGLWRGEPVEAQIDLVHGATVWYTEKKLVAGEPAS